MVPCGQEKLLDNYLGLFEMLSRKGAVAYELRLPASMSRMSLLIKRYKDGNRASVLVAGRTIYNGNACFRRLQGKMNG